MDFTDVQNGNIVTRTYANGIVIEFVNNINPNIPIPYPNEIDSINQRLFEQIQTVSDLMDVLWSTVPELSNL